MITTWQAWHGHSHTFRSLPSRYRRAPIDQIEFVARNDRPSSRDRSRLCSLSNAAMHSGNVVRCRNSPKETTR